MIRNSNKTALQVNMGRQGGFIISENIISEKRKIRIEKEEGVVALAD